MNHPVLVDIGANLGHESFRPDLEAVLGRARAAGVAQIVVTGASESESRVARDIAGARPEMLRSTAGVHPHLARDWGPGTEAALAELARSPMVVAVGEAGLDFNRDYSPRPAQERAFEAQLELGAALGLPVFLHERDAHERFLAILARHRPRLQRAVVHCFTGERRALDAYLDLDLHIGVTGWICDERRGLHLRELVALIPPGRLMLETDSPYLLPRDLRPRPRSRRNEPRHRPPILAAVASCTGRSREELAAETTATARGFFGLPAPAFTGSGVRPRGSD